MPIVYYLDFPCPVKERVPPARLLRLLYAREHAAAALDRAQRDNAAARPEDVRVDLSLKSGDGTRQLVATTVADVEAQLVELNALAGHCNDCRANIEGHAFGCRGRVDFPFSLRAESLLMGRIHASHGDPTAGMLANYFESNGITGNRAAGMRNVPGVFFESDKPLVRRLPDGRRISSNQVFELFFQHGRISPNHARFLLGMFELRQADLPVQPLLSALPNLFVVERQEAGMLVQRVGLTLTKPETDRCARQLQNFCGGLLLASELGHELLVKL